MKQDERLVRLIEVVQKISRMWEASVTSSSVAAVRDPKRKELMETAARDLARHDACKAMADEVIIQIRKHWPENPS